MIPIDLRKTLIFKALKRLKVWEDAEDAVQNAYLLYLKYQDKFDTSNPEKLINWLVNQEVIAIWKKNNGITAYGTNHGKILKFNDLSTMEMSPEEEVVARNSYFGYNEGGMLYDIKVLKARESVPYIKSEYLGEPYAEKEFGLTETLQNTKYGTYVRLALSNGRPRKYKQIRCYKHKV